MDIIKAADVNKDDDVDSSDVSRILTLLRSEIYW